jgi:hypothetical protein
MPGTKRRRRGHIRELPSGSLQAIVYAGTDPLTGRPRYLRETAAGHTAAEAAPFLTRRYSSNPWIVGIVQLFSRPSFSTAVGAFLALG